MKYAIIYSSHTGNTEQLAQQIHTFFKHDECVYYGHPSSNDIHADILFIGFWTDKGTCDGLLQDFLRKIKNQRLTKRKQNYIIIIVLNRTLIRQYNKEEKYVFLGSA